MCKTAWTILILIYKHRPYFIALEYLRFKFIWYLNWSFVCDVRYKEVHSNILTVHMGIYPFFDVSWHCCSVQIAPILWKIVRLTNKIIRASERVEIFVCQQDNYLAFFMEFMLSSFKKTANDIVVEIIETYFTFHQYNSRSWNSNSPLTMKNLSYAPAKLYVEPTGCLF